MKEFERTHAWALYEKCKDYIDRHGIRNKNEKCINFVEGKQWQTEAPKGMPQPQLNILKPMVDWKVATVLRSGLALHFSNMQMEDEEIAIFSDLIIPHLDSYVRKTWEQNNMDTHLWELCRSACICGGAAIYSYHKNGEIVVELKDNVDVLVADEQQTDIQRQKFVIIPFREMVSTLKKEAREHGVKDVDKIIPDDQDIEKELGMAKYEIDTLSEEDGKALCIMLMWKDDDGYLHFSKSTKYSDVIPDTKTLQREYPVAFLTWNKKKGSFRGNGDVAEWIPNQVEINCTLARQAVSIMNTAFPKMVYNSEYIDNPQDLAAIGAALKVDGMGFEDVKKAVGYLQMSSMSPDVRMYINDLINQTQSFSGRDVTASINPENASGKAILAVQDANAMPLSLQMAQVKKCIEDLGRIWWDIWVATAGEQGLKFVYESTEELPVMDDAENSTVEHPVAKIGVIPPDYLERMKLSLKVDVSPATAFSKYAVENSLDNLLLNKVITFEEYVDALPDDSIMPKDKLRKIVERRSELIKLQAERDEALKNYNELARAVVTAKEEGDRILGLSNASNLQ